MGKGKWMIGLLAALLLLAAAFGMEDAREEETVVSFRLASADGHMESLRLWEKQEGEYYVFLPSFGRLSQVQMYSTVPVRLGNVDVQNGMGCDAFHLQESYPLLQTAGGADTSLGNLTFVQSAQVPAMFIDTASCSMDYIHEQKGNEEPGNLRLYSPEGETVYSGGLESIKMRGNNTMVQEKEPYSLKLLEGADLLGMGAAKKWVLFSNSFDPSHMRNKFVYDFAAALGLAYSPESRWVDLYLNGEYAGLYLLSERNEVDDQRVALTGKVGFLVSEEPEDRLMEQKLPYIRTSFGAALRIHNASMGRERLKEIWDAMEQSLEADTGADPQSGTHWAERIDLDSWVKKYLIEEVFGNSDGGGISQFFYMDGTDPQEKIYAGPVWDYDMALKENQIFVDRPPDYGGSLWYSVLCRDPQFAGERNRIYSQIFVPLLNDWADSKIEEYQSLIRQAACLNQLRWDTEPMPSAVEAIKSYLDQRVPFLNSLWLEGNAYVTLSIRDINGYYSTIPVPAGEPLPEGWQNSGDVWYRVEGDGLFDLSQPITTDVAIYRMEDAPAAEPEESGEETASDSLIDWIPFSPFFLLGALLIALGLADCRRNAKTTR